MANTYSNSSLFQKLSNIKCLYPQENELIQIRTENSKVLLKKQKNGKKRANMFLHLGDPSNVITILMMFVSLRIHIYIT